MARVTFIAGHAHSLVNFRGPLIELLQTRGHKVSAIGPPAEFKTLAWFSAREIDYYPIALSRASLNPLNDISAFLAIRSALSRAQPDAVIAYTIKSVIYGLLAAKLLGVSRRFALISGLGYAFTDGTASLKRRAIGIAARQLYRISLAQAEAVIFQNPDDLALFKNLGLISRQNRVGVVNGSGVDIVRFSPVHLPSEPICLMIARLVADKGVVEYLEAARKVKALRPEVKFLLVGPSDPNPSALPPRLLEKAIADCILEYYGELDDVRTAISASSIFVLPSYREGTPRSVLEAMAMGRPIVTTDAPGCRETVIDQINGLLVPVKSVGKLVEAILQLVDQPSVREKMGDAARALAVSRYASDQVARSVVELLAL